MSSIEPAGGAQLSAVSGLQPMSTASPPPVGYLHGTLDGVANVLGMPTSDVRSALKQGSSVADLASAQGVSRSTIVDTIESQVQKLRTAKGADPLDASTLDRVVNRAIDRRLSAPSPQRPVAPPASSDRSLDLYA